MIAYRGFATAAVFAFLAGYLTAWTVNKADSRIHVLAYPLRVASPAQNDWYLLPAGTTLYYEESMAEGFDRYRVYVNVEGAALEVTEAPFRNYIAPLSAYPIEGKDILPLLRGNPVSTTELIRLLSARLGHLSECQAGDHRHRPSGAQDR